MLPRKKTSVGLYLAELISRDIETLPAVLFLDIFSALTSRHCQVRVITLDARILRRRSSND